MSDPDACVPTFNEWEGGYQFIIWQKPDSPPDGAMITLGCTSNAEAYVLAIQFMKMIGFEVTRATLNDWKGMHMMYYAPKAGWKFGDDRDLVVL